MKQLLFFLSLIVNYQLLAQQTGRMETDRPDQTESPYIVKKKYIQAEIGFNREVDKNTVTLVHPTILCKYGLHNKLELRVITSFHQQKDRLLHAKNSGLHPVQIGAKLSLTEEKGVLPKTSIIFHAGLPFAATHQYKTLHIAPNFRFAMQNTISKIISLGYNLGAAWDGDHKTPVWIYTFCTGFNIGKNVYAYGEIFGDIQNENKPNHSLAAGCAYYINDDVKLDVSAANSISTKEMWYSALGLSFRLH